MVVRVRPEHDLWTVVIRPTIDEQKICEMARNCLDFAICLDDFNKEVTYDYGGAETMWAHITYLDS